MWALLLILLTPPVDSKASYECTDLVYDKTTAKMPEEILRAAADFIFGPLAAPAINASIDAAEIAHGKLLSARTKITFYSIPNEGDFGSPTSPGIQKITYRGPDGKLHTSEFVKGFASRDSHDPLNPYVSGVGMEGSGVIDPRFHTNDHYLSEMIKSGYGILNLEDWNEKTKKATYSLEKTARGVDSPLIMGVSAAVRENNHLIHMGDCLAIFLPGDKFFGYHLVNDSCSSCVSDEHVDLLLPTSFGGDLNGDAKIYSVDKNKCPKAVLDGE